MSDKFPYELLISQKLAVLPVPDLADAIWNRIEARLDVELPPDGNDSQPDPPSTPLDTWKGAGFSIVIIAIIFLLTRLNEKPSAEQSIPAVAEPTIITSPRRNAPEPVPRNATVPATQTFKSPELPVAPPAVDSAFSAPTPVVTAAVDSARTVPAPIILTPALFPPPEKDTVVKKPRGVQGVGRDDYRIEPKKKDLND